MNTLTLVGRLIDNPTSDEIKTIINIAVSREIKNPEGEYEDDYIPCYLYSKIGKATEEYCKRGDVVGIRGKIRSNESGIYVVADKVTFLSSKKEEE